MSSSFPKHPSWIWNCVMFRNRFTKTYNPLTSSLNKYSKTLHLSENSKVYFIVKEHVLNKNLPCAVSRAYTRTKKKKNSKLKLVIRPVYQSKLLVEISQPNVLLYFSCFKFSNMIFWKRYRVGILHFRYSLINKFSFENLKGLIFFYPNKRIQNVFGKYKLYMY